MCTENTLTLDSVPLTKSYGDLLIVHFQCQFQWEAECFFHFNFWILMVQLVNEATGSVDDVHAVDGHGSLPLYAAQSIVSSLFTNCCQYFAIT